MEIYTDKNNNSNISKYEIGDDFIIIKFKSGVETFYKYTNNSSLMHIEEMKRLARCGDGLNSYINKNRVSYESKW